MKPKWLDRRVAAPGPYLTLCLFEEEYKAILKKFKIISNASWVARSRSDATVHHFEKPEGGGLLAVVCLQNWKGRDPLAVVGLLVHEAVHIWQNYAEDIGETSPGMEQEAYAIQNITQELLIEFARRMKR